MNQGEISEYMKCTISDMSNKVLEHIAVKYDSVKKGVQSVMGGKVLEYEAKTILNKGRRLGRRDSWSSVGTKKVKYSTTKYIGYNPRRI